MTNFIRAFSEITKDDVPLVGGKGANLGEMARAGLPVPPGFCIVADAYREFAAPAQEALARILGATRMDDADDVETKSAQLRALLIAQPMPAEIAQQVCDAYHALGQQMGALPLRVAVRSSATAEDMPDASFAGQQDTYLNVQGAESLLESVKRCWTSLWSARAVTYRHKQGYPHEHVALAVVVQTMIESEVAGILFTANPVTQSREEMVLNASWGLGEAIVSGLVTPDTWVAQKGGGILERDIASKEAAVTYAPDGGIQQVAVEVDKRAIPSLSDAQLQTLIALGEQVEAHYGRPMDVEWAYARGKFYMLQARPITTLWTADHRPQGTEKDAKRYAIRDAQQGEYNRTMFVEIFPDPLSPAFLSVIVPLFRSMLDFT